MDWKKGGCFFWHVLYYLYSDISSIIHLPLQLSHLFPTCYRTESSASSLFSRLLSSSFFQQTKVCWRLISVLAWFTWKASQFLLHYFLPEGSRTDSNLSVICLNTIGAVLVDFHYVAQPWRQTTFNYCQLILKVFSKPDDICQMTRWKVKRIKKLESTFRKQMKRNGATTNFIGYLSLAWFPKSSLGFVQLGADRTRLQLVG